MIDRADAPTTAHRRPSVEAWFGEWRLVERLAERGSSGLWRVVDEEDRPALLRLYPRFLPAEAWQRLVDSAEPRLGVEHPRVVAAVDVAPVGLPQVVLESCPGEPLPARIERKLLAPSLALRVLTDVLDGLDALAGPGATLVDLSPADVFLNEGRGLLLGDVGLLGETTEDGCVDRDHAAPERLTAIHDPRDRSIVRTVTRVATQRAHRRTPASTTYSFASVLFEAITGATPRPPEADDEEPDDGSAIERPRASLPPRLEDVFARALDPAPERRPQAPRELIEAVRLALADPSKPAQGDAGERTAAPPAGAPASAATAPRATSTARPSNGDAPHPKRLEPPVKQRRRTRPHVTAPASTEREHAPAPAPKSESERSARRNARVGLLAAAAILVAAAIGAAIGTATTEPDPPAPQTVARDGLGIVAPPAWIPARPSAAPLEVGDGALVVERPGVAGTGFVATRAADALLAGVAGAQRDAVSLGPRAAWRYAGVELAGVIADVYLLETVAGPVAAACYAPAAPGATVPVACARIASTLRVRRAEAVPLGGQAAARAELATALATLGRARAGGRRELAAAATPRGQALASDALAAAYASAAEAAAALGTVGGPGDQRRLVAGLERAEAAYATLATGVRAGDRAAYGAARVEILAAERALQGAIARLSRAAPE